MLENPMHSASLPETFEDFVADQFAGLLSDYLNRQYARPIKKIVSWRQYFDHSEQSLYIEVMFLRHDQEKSETYHIALWGLLGFIYCQQQ